MREDKVTDEQVNRCLVDKPLYNKYLVCRSTCLLVNLKNLVSMLLCLLLTLSTRNCLTCQLVHSSTLKTLFLCYFVFYFPCLQATRSLVYLFTRLLAHLVNFFQAYRGWEVVFWLLKDALWAGKRCPLRPLLTPFWSLNKYLLLSCFIIIWFSASYKLTHNTCFSPLFQGFYWRKCQGFWHG